MRFRKLLTTACAALALSACVVAPYYPRTVGGYDDYDSELAVVGVAPPPLYSEVRPIAPFAGALWIGGYWGWRNNNHYWVPGRWDRGRPGYAWAPYRWVPRNGGRWALRSGGWVRR